LQLTDRGLLVGHDTGIFGGEAHLRIAYCPVDYTTTLPSYVTASLPGSLVLLGKGTSQRVVSSDFDGRSDGTRQDVPTVQQWQNSRGTFVVDGVLYAGWADGTMTRQSFDGATFGATTPLALNGSFGDLSRVRTMFFERSSHRLYYALDGS